MILPCLVVLYTSRSRPQGICSCGGGAFGAPTDRALVMGSGTWFDERIPLKGSAVLAPGLEPTVRRFECQLRSFVPPLFCIIAMGEKVKKLL